MSEFITLPFGDLWCVVFAPQGQVKGICSISTSKAVADEVVKGIDAADPQVKVSRVSPNSPGYVIPCVTFEVLGSSFDWFGSDSKAERRRIPDPANYFPTLDARAVPRAPMSLSDLQALLSTQMVKPPNAADILQDLKKHYGPASEELARGIEPRLAKSGTSILKALKDVARDDSVKCHLRQEAIACAVTFDDPNKAAFLAEFVNGKNPAALHSAYENGNSIAGEEFGLFREAKSHLEEMGHTFTITKL